MVGAFITRTAGIAGIVFAAGTVITAQTRPIPDPPAQNVPIVQDLFTAQAFQERVAEYMTLHRMLEGPPLQPTIDMAEVQTNMQRLAGRILIARRNAGQGDIITPDVARMFRRQIATCLAPEEWQAILAELAEDERGVPIRGVELRVNMAWPGHVPYGFMPPQLLAALPPLPPELQYRIIGRSLVLWDHHANLIVDFMPAAFLT
jgi:hypothetical protein